MVAGELSWKTHWGGQNRKKCSLNILCIRFTIKHKKKLLIYIFRTIKASSVCKILSIFSWWYLNCSKHIYRKFFCFIVKRIPSISREKFYLTMFTFLHNPRQSNIYNGKIFNIFRSIKAPLDEYSNIYKAVFSWGWNWANCSEFRVFILYFGMQTILFILEILNKSWVI